MTRGHSKAVARAHTAPQCHRKTENMNYDMEYLVLHIYNEHFSIPCVVSSFILSLAVAKTLAHGSVPSYCRINPHLLVSSSCNIVYGRNSRCADINSHSRPVAEAIHIHWCIPVSNGTSYMIDIYIYNIYPETYIQSIISTTNDR